MAHCTPWKPWAILVLGALLLAAPAAATPAASGHHSWRKLLRFDGLSSAAAATQDCNCNIWCPTETTSWYCWPGSPRCQLPGCGSCSPCCQGGSISPPSPAPNSQACAHPWDRNWLDNGATLTCPDGSTATCGNGNFYGLKGACSGFSAWVDGSIAAQAGQWQGCPTTGPVAVDTSGGFSGSSGGGGSDGGGFGGGGSSGGGGSGGGGVTINNNCIGGTGGGGAGGGGGVGNSPAGAGVGGAGGAGCVTNNNKGGKKGPKDNGGKDPSATTNPTNPTNPTTPTNPTNPTNPTTPTKPPTDTPQPNPTKPPTDTPQPNPTTDPRLMDKLKKDAENKKLIPNPGLDTRKTVPQLTPQDPAPKQGTPQLTSLKINNNGGGTNTVAPKAAIGGGPSSGSLSFSGSSGSGTSGSQGGARFASRQSAGPGPAKPPRFQQHSRGRG